MPKFVSKNKKSLPAAAPSNAAMTVDYLRTKIADTPEVMLILGSGLGGFAKCIAQATVIPYADIPHFKTSTAPGHAGQLVVGIAGEKHVVAMQGRFHTYEGYSAYDVAYPVHVAAKLGIKKLIVSCACGGLNPDYAVGDFALISDYANLTARSPLIGFDHREYGDRFIDMSSLLDDGMKKAARGAAEKTKVRLHEGVYFHMPGPQYETPAEIRALKILGADLVGMSLVHEAIMAKRCGMGLLAFGLVTNIACGLSDDPLSESEVLSAGKKAAAKFEKLVLETLNLL